VQVNQFRHDPRKRHMQIVDKNSLILQVKPKKGVLLQEMRHFDPIYTDTDYAGFVVDKNSTSRYCVFLG